jgi:hypothetical protein
MTSPTPHLCPCGEIHELTAALRSAYVASAGGQPDALFQMPDGQSWYVPRIFMAAHKDELMAEGIPVLAQRYGFRPGA